MQRGGGASSATSGAKKDHKKNKKKVPEATTAHFNADNIAETALQHLSEMWPRKWKDLNEKNLVVEVKRIVATVKDTEKDMAARQRAMSVLDALTWHSRTKKRLLGKDIAADDLLCALCFGDVPEKDRPLTIVALNTLNKMALSNGRALLKRGIFKQLVLLGQQQLQKKQQPKEEGKEKEQQQEEEHRQKVLLGVANLFLTFANDKEFRIPLALGGTDASAEDGTTALDLLLTFLNDLSFPLSLRGSAGMALMKLCETCERGEDCMKVVTEKVIKTNAIKTLVLLLLKGGTEEEENKEQGAEEKEQEGAAGNEEAAGKKPRFDEAAFTNKAIVLDVLHALSNLDSYDNEAETGEMTDRIIKAGGCVVCCMLIHKMASSPALQSPQTAPAQIKEAKACLDVVRAAVTLISSMAYIASARKPIIAAKGVDALVAGILHCNHDSHTISFGCRAIYMLEKDMVTSPLNEDEAAADLKREIKTGGIDNARTEIVRSNSGQKEGDSSSSDSPAKRAVEEAQARLADYAVSLIPLLNQVIKACDLPSVRFPSNTAYMLRHACLLLFLFSSVPGILHRMIHEQEMQVLDSLCLLLDSKLVQVQINALAVLTSFVDTEEGAKKLCETPRVLKLLAGLESGSIPGGEHLMENVSYIIQGLRLRASDDLEKLNIQFTKLNIAGANGAGGGGNTSAANAAGGGGVGGVAAGERLKCALCGVSEDGDKVKMQVCSRCKETAYCSREHQRGHWQVHKENCKQK